jgi:hypothetical protein
MTMDPAKYRVPDWVWVIGAAVLVAIPIAIICEAAFHDDSEKTIETVLIVCGSLFSLGMLLLLWQLFRYVRAIDRRQSVLSYQVHDDTGLLMKGHVRNVAMRVDTMTELIEALGQDVAGRTPEEHLKAAGIAVGKSWSSAFMNIRQREKRASSHEEQLSLWSDYDATAGWGRFEFHLNAEGHGSVTLRNGFLSKCQDEKENPGSPTGRKLCLEHFIAGYLEQSISSIFGTRVAVTLDKPGECMGDERAEFMVERPRTDQPGPSVGTPFVGTPSVGTGADVGEAPVPEDVSAGGTAVSG